MNRDYLERISPERQQFIFDMANDEWVNRLEARVREDDAAFARLVEEMQQQTRRFVETCTDGLELHCFADHWNWDGGVAPLVKIAEHPHCDAATALLLFWRATPTFYLPFPTRDEVPDWSRETFDLIELIQARYVRGAYSSGKISYDPAEDVRMQEPIPGQREIPAAMVQAVIAR